MRIFVAAILLLVSFVQIESAYSDERSFTYIYEANVLKEGDLEFEQWLTNENGKEDGDYSKFGFRSELEYGITDRLMGALYLNFDQTRSEGVSGEEDEDEFTFEGFSAEFIYQLSNPRLDLIGSALYVEYTTDGIDQELESKILLSKDIEPFILAANAIYEMEWEREDNRTEREGTLEFTFGGSYKFDPKWAIGIEARNKSAYPDGLDLTGQEYQTWSVGPNIHYGGSKWWATLTILPQVWGNGDGSEGSRQLVHEESMEVRLIVGTSL